MGKQHERTLSRQMAVQALYRCLVTPAYVPEAGESEGELEGVSRLDAQAEEPGAPTPYRYAVDGSLPEQTPTLSDQIAVFAESDEELPDAGRIPEYGKRLLKGMAGEMERIDGMLADTSENWSVERMPLVDHAILLVATYEMLEVPEVPVSVCINEAVELAKAFGGEDDSARFVNGVLGRIARTYCADRATQDGDGAFDDELLEA